MMYRKLLTTSLCSLTVALSSAVYAADEEPATQTAEVASSQDENVTVDGWSVNEHLIGTKVYNEEEEEIGQIRDVILDDDGKATDYIVGVGGFLGMGEHNVLIPIDDLEKKGSEDDKYGLEFQLDGYTKDQLKEMPKAKLEEPDTSEEADMGDEGSASGGAVMPED